MKIGVFGGTFNPPHIGHTAAASAAVRELELDLLIIMPAGDPPHKRMPADSPPIDIRYEMAALAFSGMENVKVSDIEIKGSGKSYTIDTIKTLREKYKDSDFFLILGADMFVTLETWKDSGELLKLATPAVLLRCDDDGEKIKEYVPCIKDKFGVNTRTVPNEVISVSSSYIREFLPLREGVGYIDDTIYTYIVKHQLYGARVNYDWLREKAYGMLPPSRIPHVAGCEGEAVSLALRWGADADHAREAAILHDITKCLPLDEQLFLCRKHDIIIDDIERKTEKLLHSKTGAAYARAEFGMGAEVCGAIAWHTTGRADMSLLEKVMYAADYIEPTRDFDGVDRLRRLAFEDLDAALLLGLQMSVEDLADRGVTPHPRTFEAIHFLQGRDLKV